MLRRLGVRGPLDSFRLQVVWWQPVLPPMADVCYTSRQAFHTNPPNRQHLHRPGLTNRVVVRLRGFFLHDP